MSLKESRRCPAGNVLLPRMYWKNGAYWHVQRNKWRRLASRYADALRAYATVEAPSGTWATLVELAYEDFAGLKPNTRAQYDGIKARIIHGFSDFEPHEITGTHVVQFLDLYRQTPNIANRMLSVLKQVFDRGMRTGACDINPAFTVKRFKEAKRDRYLADEEYAAIYEKANPTIKAVMDLCYLTGQRIGDVLKIRRSDISDQGIAFEQEKTGAKLVVQMTPDLKAAVERAKALRAVPCAFLLHPKGKGAPYSYRAVRDAYERARRAAGVPDTTLHDLRAKSLTDTKKAGGNATALAGHRLESTTLRYLRGTDVPVVSGPKKLGA